MSDDNNKNPVVAQFNVDWEKEQALEQKREALKEKELILKERRVNGALEQLNKADQEIEFANNISYGEMGSEEILRMRKENSEYIAAAKTSMPFINKEFSGIVPFFRKNLILIGGKTGEGKSTTVANIVASTISQRKPDGSRKRVLVLVNEEKAEDVYNRIVCLQKGWAYTNHDKFTDEQTEAFDAGLGYLPAVLTVVDPSFKGGVGVTTSIEGIRGVFQNLIKDKNYYDAVIIDYYQNIKHSKTNPDATEYEVQAQLVAMLDQFKNEYPAPIVVMAQVQPPDKEKKTPFEYRIKGRKVITDPATCIIEMVADRENLRTEWIIHKSRFTEAVGASFYTGYRRGKYVEYDNIFMQEAATIQEERARNRLTRGVGLPSKDDGESK